MENISFYKKAQKIKNINAFAALCQCYHETRTGGKPWSSELCVNANNFAGIKVTADWTGARYEKTSWEQKPDGTKYNKVSLFRKYLSLEDFLKDYEAKIIMNYPECVRKKESFWGYFDGLLSERPYRWATDRAYFTRLTEIAVLLAPEIFGKNWKNKLKTSLVYAIDNDYLSEENARTALAIIHDLLQKDKPIPAPPIDDVPGKGKRTGVVCVDPGHGGNDPGACAGGKREKDIALALTYKLCRELTSRGFEVRLTRVADETVSLGSRSDFANRNECELFVSLHLNAATNPKAEGHECWIAPGASKGAFFIANEICRQWGKKFPKAIIRGVKASNFHVLKHTTMPAVLVETCFITNEKERNWIAEKETQENAVSAIANAVGAFFKGGHYE